MQSVTIARPPVVSQTEWEAALAVMTEREETVAAAMHELAAARKRMPMVRVEHDYSFEGPTGGGRCPSCSTGAASSSGASCRSRPTAGSPTTRTPPTAGPKRPSRSGTAVMTSSMIHRRRPAASTTPTTSPNSRRYRRPAFGIIGRVTWTLQFEQSVLARQGLDRLCRVKRPDSVSSVDTSAVAARLTSVDVTVRRVRADEGPVLKAIRLAALLESPSAFGSTHAAEVDQPDDHWASRASLGAAGRNSAIYLAIVDQSVVGIVGGYRPDPAGSSIELVSMWVSPAQRRAGIAAKLVEAVVGWASETNATSVDLWVTRGNDAAVRLYEAAGFRETDEHQPLPSDPCKDEQRMRRALG